LAPAGPRTSLQVLHLHQHAPRVDSFNIAFCLAFFVVGFFLFLVCSFVPIQPLNALKCIYWRCQTRLLVIEVSSTVKSVLMVTCL
jgi:hypothetical protein